MDIVGPLPITKNENRYILTIQDHLTKYSLAIPLQNMTAACVADAFVKKFICTFGAPRAVLTDQGTNFMSALMRRVAKYFLIKQYRTTAFYPQANGSLERSHIVLIEYLKQYASKDKEWDEWLELAACSYNTSIHEGTHYSPYELIFGRMARLPSNEILDDEDQLLTYDDYLTRLITHFHKIQTLAHQNLVTAKIRSKKYYDRKIHPQEFNVGDSVYVLNEPKGGKFGNQYNGPYEIIEILEKGNAKILVKNKPRVVHSNKLRHSYIHHSREID